MSKYLLEIGTEELPANFSHSVLNQFKSQIEFEFDKKLIKFEKIFCTSTPRRIVLLLEGLVDKGEDKMIIRKGPKASSAFINGTPTKAAVGFANSLGIDVDDLEIENTENNKINLKELLKKIHSLKFNDILLESGPTLITSFINEDLIDEFIIYIAPKMLSNTALSFFDGEESKSPFHSNQFELIEESTIKEDKKLIFKRI